MEEIYDRWIRGRQSMVALTDKSEVFKTKFADLVKAEGDSRVANMRWAKHRHESMVRPLGRSVLNISAQLELAAWVVTTRHGAVEAKVAKSWLEWMDEERYIQACMMADGGDEVMLLLRYMDNEEMAVEESMDRVWLLRKHLFFLFGPERGCKKVGGYTQEGLADVKRSRYVVARGQIFKFGGPSVDVDSIVDRCLARMHTWLVTHSSRHLAPNCILFKLRGPRSWVEGSGALGLGSDASPMRRLGSGATSGRPCLVGTQSPAIRGQLPVCHRGSDYVFLFCVCCASFAWAMSFRRRVQVFKR